MKNIQEMSVIKFMEKQNFSSDN